MIQSIRRRVFRDSGHIRHLSVHEILPNPAQPRRRFQMEELRGLADSIRENGVLQPITVRSSDGAYYLVAGERRLRAARMAGLGEIPCIISDIDEKSSALIALVENLQRCDLSFFEEALGIARMIESYGFSQEETAKKLGKTQSAVSNKLRLLRLPGEVAEKIIRANLSERHARALLRIKDAARQLRTTEYIISHELNVAQTDEYIDALLSREKETDRRPEPRRTYIIKDVRLFFNTITRAVDTMRASGVNACVVREETDKAILMTIQIPK